MFLNSLLILKGLLPDLILLLLNAFELRLKLISVRDVLPLLGINRIDSFLMFLLIQFILDNSLLVIYPLCEFSANLV